MVTLNSGFKVLIIGSGVAGLSLAQILRKEGISCEVFERDDGSRSQGWSISLDQCIDALGSLLPDDLAGLQTASANQAAGKADGFTFIDGRTDEFLGIVGNVDSTHFGHHIAASRDVFRKILMQHLNVQFSKRFARYEEDRDGVTVHFEDGTTARGSILIGADGANSSVRAQLLPDFKPVLSKFVSISGNVVLPKHLYGPLLNRGNTGIISGEPGLKFYILVLEYLDDDTALFNWLCALQSEEAEADHEWAREASEESLLKKALMILNHFPSYIVDAVKCTGPTGMHKPPIRLLETILPLQSLPKGRVTLMGDSAHSMIPFRGMGANMAILDACDLGQGLIAGIKDGVGLEWVLKSYEDKIIPRGREQVLASRATGESEDPLEISGGRLQKLRMMELAAREGGSL